MIFSAFHILEKDSHCMIFSAFHVQEKDDFLCLSRAGEGFLLYISLILWRIGDGSA